MNERAWIALIAACVLLVAAVAVQRDYSRPKPLPSPDKINPPTLESAAVPLVTGE